MKRTKKLISALLAIVMIASLTVPAFAYTAKAGGNAANIAPDATDAARTKAADAWDTSSGTIGNEGAVPVGGISIVLPATPANIFDLLLDPHDLLKATNHDRYKSAKFDASVSHHAYFNSEFKETAEAAKAVNGYTDTSKALTVYNKGFYPVKVTVAAELDKGNYKQIVTVNSLDDLHDSEDDSEAPALYLAVKGTSTVPAITKSANDKAIEGKSEDLTAAPLKEDWGVPTLAASGSLLSLTPTFTYAEGILLREKQAFEKAVTVADAKLTVTVSKQTVTAGTLPEAFTMATAPAFSSEVTGYSILGGDDATYIPNMATGKGTITIQKGTGDDAVTIGTISLDYDMAAIYALSQNSTIDITFTGYHGKPIALVDSSIPTTDSYKLTWVPTPVEQGQQVVQSTGDYQQVQATAAPYNKLETGFASLTFKLTAAINNTEAWDSIKAAATSAATVTGLTTRVVWDVRDDPVAKDPSVKVTKYAVNADDEVELSVKFGQGDKAAVAVQSITFGSTTSVIGLPVPDAATDGASHPGFVSTQVNNNAVVNKATAETWKFRAVEGVTNNTGDAKVTINFLLADGTTKGVEVQIQKADA